MKAFPNVPSRFPACLADVMGFHVLINCYANRISGIDPPESGVKWTVLGLFLAKYAIICRVIDLVRIISLL